MANEKRQQPRAEISWPVTIVSPDYLVTCRTKNLSLVGTLIRCFELPELLGNFRLVFKPTERQLLIATAERVWSETPANDNSMSYAMGVKFTFIPDRDYQLMSKAISGHL